MTHTVAVLHGPRTPAAVSGWTVPGYCEIAELGRGAAGVVRLAEHDATGRQVAIKYLSDELQADPEFRAAFRTEAGLLGEVDSPNVVSLYEYVEGTDGAAIVMELVEGAPLRAMLEQHGPTEPEAALCVLKGSLLGLGAAHAVGVVHRDYKPENVLVDATGQSALTDFGVAARTGGDAVGGTPSYMPPEQWRGDPPSPRGDTYAATATFVECLTGHPPFEAPDLDLLRKQHERAPVPVDELPAPVRDLARHGLAKDPGDRPQDAARFLTELARAATAGYGEDWEERGRASLGRRAALLALLFPLAAAGLTGATTVAVTRLGARPAATPGKPAAAPARGGPAAGRPPVKGAGAPSRRRAPIAAGIAAGLMVGGSALALHPDRPGRSAEPVGPISSTSDQRPAPVPRLIPDDPKPVTEPDPPPLPAAAKNPGQVLAPADEPEKKPDREEEPSGQRKSSEDQKASGRAKSNRDEPRDSSPPIRTEDVKGKNPSKKPEQDDPASRNGQKPDKTSSKKPDKGEQSSSSGKKSDDGDEVEAAGGADAPAKDESDDPPAQNQGDIPDSSVDYGNYVGGGDSGPKVN